MELQPNEIESYFAHDGTYLDATIHNYSSYWRFRVAWQHTDLRQPIEISDIPDNTIDLQRMAIARYETYKRLRGMDSDISAV